MRAVFDQLKGVKVAIVLNMDGGEADDTVQAGNADDNADIRSYLDKMVRSLTGIGNPADSDTIEDYHDEMYGV